MADEPTDISKALEKADESITTKNALAAKHAKQDGEVRTYATDIGEMMKKQKGSVIKIALAEQKRRDEYKKKTDPTATRNIVVVMLGFVLIVGGIMIFIYTVMNRARPVEVTNFVPTLPSFIFTENQVQIDVTELNRTELIAAIRAQVNNMTLGAETINNLFVSYRGVSGQAQIPSTAFLQKLGVDIPDTLALNLYPEFSLGVYSLPEGNDLFMILRVKDFNEAFSAMREWESYMLTEMVRLYSIDTKDYGKEIFTKDFENETIYNKEARILKDKAGKAILSYIFLDTRTVMITTQTDSVGEVIKRINQQTIK
jgi:hypothetical protein